MQIACIIIYSGKINEWQIWASKPCPSTLAITISKDLHVCTYHQVVPQSSHHIVCLSNVPLLFSIFLNDLDQFLTTDSKGINVEYSNENLDFYKKYLYYHMRTIQFYFVSHQKTYKRCSIYYINSVTGGNYRSTRVKLKSWFFQKVHLESDHINVFWGEKNWKL